MRPMTCGARASLLSIVGVVALLAAWAPDAEAGSVDFAARAYLWIECFSGGKDWQNVKGWTGSRQYSSGTHNVGNQSAWCLIYPAKWPYGDPPGAAYRDVWSSGGTEAYPRGVPIWIEVGAGQRVLCTGLEKFMHDAPLQPEWFTRPVCN